MKSLFNYLFITQKSKNDAIKVITGLILVPIGYFLADWMGLIENFKQIIEGLTIGNGNLN